VAQNQGAFRICVSQNLDVLAQCSHFGAPKQKIGSCVPAAYLRKSPFQRQAAGAVKLFAGARRAT
jgi:hypothetical protein